MEITNTSNIKYIVLSGGGVKGTIYLGMFEGLKTAKIIDGVEAFSGTSAGANTAAFLAVGISVETLKEKVFDIDLRHKLGTGYFGLFNDGAPVIDFINDLLIETIHKNIQNINLDTVKLSPEEQERYSKLQLQIEEDEKEIPDPKNANISGSSKRRLITFGDLALLRKINPKKFKDLYVTVVKKADFSKKIFSTKDEASNSISIAEACRASSSLPILFTPATIENDNYIDGAIKDNMPYTVFENPDITTQENDTIPKYISETLIFTLDENGQDINRNFIYKALHGSPREKEIWQPTMIERFMFFIMWALGYIPGEYKNNQKKSYKDIRQTLSCSIVNLDALGLSIRSFQTANDMGDEKYCKGYFSTIEHLINYEKLQHLTDEEYKVLVHKTRLQEFFFKVITGANLNRKTQLYKDLMAFCKDEKFEKYQPNPVKHIPSNEGHEVLKQKYEKHVEWVKRQQERWDQMPEDEKTRYNKILNNEKAQCTQDPYKIFLAQQNGYDQWEQIKNQYNETIHQFEQFNNLDYLKPLVNEFQEIINHSNNASAESARRKLQKSLKKNMDDKSYSPQNIKNLFQENIGSKSSVICIKA